jgi:cytochrome c oxidase cbb3-type subunit I/II
VYKSIREEILGTPGFPDKLDEVIANARTQASEITEELRVQGRFVNPDREIVAMIAYLHQLGQSVPVPARTAAVAP